jgi:hypothetical protein
MAILLRPQAVNPISVNNVQGAKLLSLIGWIKFNAGKVLDPAQ